MYACLVLLTCANPADKRVEAADRGEEAGAEDLRGRILREHPCSTSSTPALPRAACLPQREHVHFAATIPVLPRAHVSSLREHACSTLSTPVLPVVLRV